MLSVARLVVWGMYLSFSDTDHNPLPLKRFNTNSRLPYGLDVLQGKPLFLTSNDNNSKTCTSQDVHRATVDPFLLPGTPSVSFFVDYQCSPAANQGVLFSFGLFDISLACDIDQQVLRVGPTTSSSSFASMKSPSVATNTLLLSVDGASGTVTICSNGINQTFTVPAALFSILKRKNDVMEGTLTLGGRHDKQKTVNAVITTFYLSDTAAVLTCGGATEAFLNGNSNFTLPTPILEQWPPGDLSIHQNATFTVETASSVKKASLTFYGVPRAYCQTSECGDESVQASLKTISFPQPGRYIVRARVLYWSGQTVHYDHVVIVRKIDDAGAAACCRQTPLIIAQQLGRPGDRTYHRAEWSKEQALNTFGWSLNDWQGPDVEAERLYDYGLLAPPISSTTSFSEVLNCQNTRLAGVDSPILYGTTDAVKAHTKGHGKVFIYVPAGFPWANASQVDCQTHWTGWQKSGPYTTLTENDGEVCSTSCTKQGTELLINQTGMYDTLNQALITASYGQLALLPTPLVLPETPIPQNSLITAGTFDYYELPAKRALLSNGTSYWSYMELVPSAKHRVPKFKAWSSGMASPGGAVIAQCYATAYYSIHEIGHRLGFKHANIYKLKDSGVENHAPVDPLSPLGEISSAGYSDALDVMACCKSDYGLYHRLMAGWLMHDSERISLQESDIVSDGSSSFTFNLWPFDRSESRSNLMALTLRTSADEILILGLRSFPHWQEVAANVVSQDVRTNIAGIAVWVVKRNKETGVWSDAGLLDFNVLYRDWPHALPSKDGEFPKLSHFALIKDGYSWYDPKSRFVLSVDSLSEENCVGTKNEVWRYGVNEFYGYRGEWPGLEKKPVKGNYNGPKELRCAKVTLQTGVESPLSDKMTVNVTATYGGGLLGLDVHWSSANRVRTVIFKDMLNQTIVTIAPKPTSTNVSVSIPTLTRSTPIYAHVLAFDGRHTGLAVHYTTDNTVSVVSRYYGPRGFQSEEESVSVQHQESTSFAVAVVASCAVASLMLTLILCGCCWWWWRRRSDWGSPARAADKA